MEWHNTAFKFEATAKLMQEELEDEGIRTDFSPPVTVIIMQVGVRLGKNNIKKPSKLSAATLIE